MDSEESKIVGHFTMADGSHRPMTAEQAKELWDRIEAKRKARAEAMPDEQSALVAMHDAYDRLRELGWRQAIYCPKDGTWFDAIEAGSTGIHDCHYHGEWPNGSWWVAEAGDLWPSRPILFRLKPPSRSNE